MEKNINWKYLNIQMEYKNTNLIAEIKYWSKDYVLTLKEPFVSTMESHLLYNIPVKFDICNTKERLIVINILEESIKGMKKLYKKELTKLNIL